MQSLKLTLGFIIFISLKLSKNSRVWYIFWVKDVIHFLSYGYDIFFESRVCYIFLSHRCDTCLNLTFSVTKCNKHVKNMFKRVDLHSRFRIFLTGCRLFPTIKILVISLVTDLTSTTKNYFFYLHVYY